MQAILGGERQGRFVVQASSASPFIQTDLVARPHFYKASAFLIAAVQQRGLTQALSRDLSLMKLEKIESIRSVEIVELFRSAFAASEGADEGELIAKLVAELCKIICDGNVICFAASEKGLILGSIFFTKLIYESKSKVFMLAPVAVSTAYQKRGIGTKIINYGLQQIKSYGADVVVTYGDPAYYSKVGFSPLPESRLRAPKKLSMPFGWLGQSLSEHEIPSIPGRPDCVEPFNHEKYW